MEYELLQDVKLWGGPKITWKEIDGKDLRIQQVRKAQQFISASGTGTDRQWWW